MDLIKTEQGYIYKGVAVVREKNGEFSFGWISHKNHGRSYPDTLKRTLEKIDTELLYYPIERYKIDKRKG